MSKLNYSQTLVKDEIFFELFKTKKETNGARKILYNDTDEATLSLSFSWENGYDTQFTPDELLSIAS